MEGKNKEKQELSCFTSLSESTFSPLTLEGFFAIIYLITSFTTASSSRFPLPQIIGNSNTSKFVYKDSKSCKQN